MTEDPSSKRVTPRVDVTLKVALQYPDRETFVERFSINVSKTGLFIRARDPAPVGSRVRFEYRLKDDSRILRGTGIVRWARAAANAKEPESPPGMGIEFVDLDPQSEELVNLIVAQRGEGERAPRKAAVKPRAETAPGTNSPQLVPELDAEEEELLSGLELGGAPPKVRDDTPRFTEAQRQSAEADSLSALEIPDLDPLAALAAAAPEADPFALSTSAPQAKHAPPAASPARSPSRAPPQTPAVAPLTLAATATATSANSAIGTEPDLDPLAELEALIDSPVPPKAPVEATRPPVESTEPVVDPDAPHVRLDLAGASVLATLLMPNDGAPADRFDERKLELTANVRDGRLVLGQSGVATRSLYAWADTKLTLRNRLAAESGGLTLTRDTLGRPTINVDGTSIALVDLAVAAAKYTLDAYREQLGVTPSFRIIVPATIAMTLRAELTTLASSASSTAQLVDDVIAIADTAKQSEAVVISVSEFETRIARISGRGTTQLAIADGLTDIDTLVCQATARALLKEHGIDADDDASLRESLMKQVHLARKDGDGSDWHVSIAGASVTMTAEAIGKAIEPAVRRIATAVDTMRSGGVVVLAGDERLWSVIADRLETLLGPIETLDSSAWLRVGF